MEQEGDGVSVIIKGMEMPQRCMDCGVDTGLCGLWNGYDGRYSRRHPRCPLVDIPTPHGRLIDGDAYIKMMEEKCDHESSLDEWVLKVCRGGVSIMPTVIEAEGSEE